MSNSLSDKKKEALRITSRFLKEIGLYDLWFKYLYDPKTSKSWIDKRDDYFSSDDILGCTNFTDYVCKHKPSFNPNGYLMFDLLHYYLTALKSPSNSFGPVKIDNERKKVTLFDY